MHIYASAWMKRKGFHRKSELQMFLSISGGHSGGPKLSTNTASPYKVPLKVRETFQQIIQQLYATKS